MGTKTSKLAWLTSGQVDPTADFLPIVDASAGVTKRVKFSDVAPSTNSILKGWINSLSYTSATRDVDGVITTATVAWPDGSAGTYTVTTKNAIWLRVDAYTVTHTSSGKTVTQAAVTRDANGNITAQPALTIAP
jgi:hypothetical protein